MTELEEGDEGMGEVVLRIGDETKWQGREQKASHDGQEIGIMDVVGWRVEYMYRLERSSTLSVHQDNPLLIKPMTLQFSHSTSFPVELREIRSHEPLILNTARLDTTSNEATTETNTGASCTRGIRRQSLRDTRQDAIKSPTSMHFSDGKAAIQEMQATCVIRVTPAIYHFSDLPLDVPLIIYDLLDVRSKLIPVPVFTGLSVPERTAPLPFLAVYPLLLGCRTMRYELWQVLQIAFEVERARLKQLEHGRGHSRQPMLAALSLELLGDRGSVGWLELVEGYWSGVTS
nr:hypothetical protein B0A51_14289 [Rachicladosporium sp. CCFEE 5018]